MAGPQARGKIPKTFKMQPIPTLIVILRRSRLNPISFGIDRVLNVLGVLGILPRATYAASGL